ncbi:hypothetical protein PR048_006616 [Dryococelus australis]|uniref:Uncharacterized protein n=1 Tax=Dryococelus australis TaxID=614101 RepID=A0ABQ9IDP0_9NEOP|nr:hypothetical protein PR048_006616 [Dryococelus australis]
MPVIGGFSQWSPISLLLHSCPPPYSPHLNLIDSLDSAVDSCPNLFTTTRRNELKLWRSPPPPIRPTDHGRCFAVLTQRNIFSDPLAIEWCNGISIVVDRFGAAIPNFIPRFRMFWISSHYSLQILRRIHLNNNHRQSMFIEYRLETPNKDTRCRPAHKAARDDPGEHHQKRPSGTVPCARICILSTQCGTEIPACCTVAGCSEMLMESVPLAANQLAGSRPDAWRAPTRCRDCLSRPGEGLSDTAPRREVPPRQRCVCVGPRVAADQSHDATRAHLVISRVRVDTRFACLLQTRRIWLHPGVKVIRVNSTHPSSVGRFARLLTKRS